MQWSIQLVNCPLWFIAIWQPVCDWATELHGIFLGCLSQSNFLSKKPPLIEKKGKQNKMFIFWRPDFCKHKEAFKWLKTSAGVFLVLNTTEWAWFVLQHFGSDPAWQAGVNPVSWALVLALLWTPGCDGFAWKQKAAGRETKGEMRKRRGRGGKRQFLTQSCGKEHTTKCFSERRICSFLQFS